MCDLRGPTLSFLDFGLLSGFPRPQKKKKNNKQGSPPLREKKKKKQKKKNPGCRGPGSRPPGSSRFRFSEPRGASSSSVARGEPPGGAKSLGRWPKSEARNRPKIAGSSPFEPYLTFKAFEWMIPKKIRSTEGNSCRMLQLVPEAALSPTERPYLNPQNPET